MEKVDDAVLNNIFFINNNKYEERDYNWKW